MNDKLKGRYDFHSNPINWSYLNLGKEVLIQIKKNVNKINLVKKIRLLIKK